MIETLNNIADKWFAWELAIAWQVTLLIVIVWVIDLLIKKWAWPQVRYALWLLILLKLILPPSLTSPTSFTAEIPFIAQKAVNVQINQPETMPEVVNITKPAEFVIAPSENVTHYAQTPAEPTPVKATAQPAKAIPAAASLSWKAYAFFIWLAGILVLSAWLIIRLTGLRCEHLKGEHQANPPDRFKELLQSTAHKLNLKRVPRIILTNKVCCPAVFGVIKPVLLMPADKLKNLTRQDAEHILLHELAHIKRGDLFIHAVHMILQIAYWFNPLLWLIRKQLQNLRELCCDATVAKILKEKTFGYRRTLLETARQLLAEPVDPGLGLLGLFENSNWLVDRLKWLEKKTWKNRPLRIVTIFVLVCLMSATVLPMAKAKKQSGPTIAKRVTLPYSVWMAEIGIDDVMKILDLASGEIVELSGFKKGTDFIERIDLTPKGDVYVSYRKDTNKPLIAFLKGAGLKGEAATNENSIASPQVMEIPWETTVTTRQGHKYLFSLLSFDEKECVIEYKPLNRAAKKAMAKAASGQPEFIIKGTVTDVQTGRPIAGAKVGDVEKYAEGKQCTTTDSNGNYEYKTWYEEHGVKCEASGYKTETAGLLTKLFGSEKKKVVNFQLQPETTDTELSSHLQSLVENFFKHNYRDVTSRKTIKWGNPTIDSDGNLSISYEYEMIIWDKDKFLANEVFTFDKDGKFLNVQKVKGFPKSLGSVEVPPEDVSTKESIQKLVEKFFTRNYRDITARKTLEWGEPVRDENGNVSIRYKYEATIWGKDKIITDQAFVFDKDGKLISYDKISPFTATLPNSVTVELVGVCDYPEGKPRCWLPNGASIEEQIFVKREHEEANYGFVVKVDGPEDMSFMWRNVEGCGRRWGSCEVLDNQNRPVEGYYATVGVVDSMPTTTSIRIGIATEPWQTVASHNGRGMTTTGEKNLLFSQAFETKRYVGLTVSAPWRKDRAERIVAIDKDGQVYTGSVGSIASGDIDQFTAKFYELKLSQIAEFAFQDRPYQWVTFKNVSLKPNFNLSHRETDVQIEVKKSAGQAEAEKSSGLLGYWSFDGNANDSSSNGNHGTVHGATLMGGVKGSAYYFDAHQDYISLPQIHLKAFTFSAWVKAKLPQKKSKRPKRPVIIENGRKVTYYESVSEDVYESFDNSRIFFVLDNEQRFYAIQSNNKGGIGFSASDSTGKINWDIGVNEYDWSFDNDLWTHIAVTYDGSTVNIYKNGELTETGKGDFITELTGTAYIGGTQKLRGEFWHGMIDEVALYSRVLSSEEIKKLYNKTAQSITSSKNQKTETTDKETIVKKLQILQKQRERVERDLFAAEKSLYEVRDRFGITDLEERSYPHPITARLTRLQKERDDCVLEVAQLKEKINIVKQTADNEVKESKEFKKAEEDFFVLQRKCKELEKMVEEAKAEKKNLDLARSQYQKRVGVRDERKEMLNSIKSRIEKLRIMYEEAENSILEKNTKAAKKLKIIVYEGGKEPEITLNIPLTALKIANGLLPPKAKSQMLAQGINLEEILKQVDEGLEPTTLLDVKDGAERVIISLE